jgi:hypothetical protein
MQLAVDRIDHPTYLTITNIPHGIMNAQDSDPKQRNRNRMMLIAIFAIFFGGFVIAGLLRFSGWRPEAMKNHGELLSPPADLRTVVPQLVEGGEYRWNPGERMWRIVLVAPKGCAAPCVKLSHDLELVRELFAQNADRVHILWVGDFPEGGLRTGAVRQLKDDPALRAGLPRLEEGSNGDASKGLPVYVIDPNGFVILRYAPGFDLGHLRTDLNRLLKLK